MTAHPDVMPARGSSSHGSHVGPGAGRAGRAGRADWGTPWVVAFVVLLYVFGVDIRLRAVGAMGFPAAFVGYAVLLVWGVRVLRRPRSFFSGATPVRYLVFALAVASLIAWANGQLAFISPTAQLSADRWLMMISLVMGLVLALSEGVRTALGVIRVVDAIVLAVAAMCVVAAVQFVSGSRPDETLRTLLPGFTVNDAVNLSLNVRGGFTRVTGTSTHPIELGAVSAMVLPLAIARALQTRGLHRLLMLAALAMVLLGLALTVSRSALLGLVVALVLFLPMTRRSVRAAGTVLALMLAAMVYLLAPKYADTMISLVTGAATDTSVTTRLMDYASLSERLGEHFWLGVGGGTYVPDTALSILDNQYLKSLIELGALGCLGMLAFLLVPPVLAYTVRRHAAAQPELRLLLGALASGTATMISMSMTFDSWSFPMYVCTFALLVGLTGAAWGCVRSPARCGEKRRLDV